MHSFHYDHITIHHNNDLHSTSDVIVSVGDVEVRVPQRAIVEFVAQLVTSERIATLEQADYTEAFGLGKR